MTVVSGGKRSNAEMVFGKYQVIRRLAIGGMGEIFLARQRGVAGFDRLVILKSLLPELAEQPGLVEEFLDEARIAATLNHPHVVSIFEVGEWAGVYFIAMEYIRGENLGRLLQIAQHDQVDVPIAVAVRILHDAALGLDHAHQATDTDGRPLGIVHRDVSLQNIMVRDDGVTKVVDFGIARAANRANRTRTGLVKGKLTYMSPEQAADRPLDRRSDQFSLGVVAWEVVTQQRLFKADNELVTLRKLLTEPIPAPSSINPRCPPELDAIVGRMLEREPERRYSSCGEVARELAQVLDRLGGTSSGAEGQREVATFVQRLLGERLAEATKDLTPTAHSPFSALLGLTGLRGDMSDASLDPTRRTMRPGRRRLALALLATVLVAGLAAVWSSAAGRSSLERLFSLFGAERREVATVSPPPSQAPAEATELDIREPKGARVFIDGVLWNEPVPTVVRGLAPGVHEVRLELDGHSPLVRRVSVEIGAPTLLREAPVPLAPPAPPVRPTPPIKKSVARAPPVVQRAPPPAPAENGFLTLRTTPWVKVSIDGKPFGSTPLYKAELAPGQRRLQLVNEELGIDVERVISISAGKTKKLDLQLP